VDLIRIYQCFCDETRLRILNLLNAGPLCVCHFQALLGESQVKISKHLAYLKARKLVEAHRHQNWVIYRLPEKRSPELEKNLRCLQDCVQTHRAFKADLRKLRAMNPRLDWVEGALSCCT
jgi:ArsR family transcriptional regulator, arsenate/arsenite/antimonite-responsive transcriptional repressor